MTSRISNHGSASMLLMALVGFSFIAASVAAGGYPGAAADVLPAYLNDRGPGTPASIFGTYIQKGELVVYPFWEYYHDNNAEYKPSSFGVASEQDYRGKYRANEALLFAGYGLSERVVLEFEAAVVGAELNPSSSDKTAMPAEVEEWGLGDVQTQINWMWSKETARRPAYYSYLEVVYPFNKNHQLIGTPNFEFKAGTGLVRGFGWGTMSIRGGLNYLAEGHKFEVGGMAIEYLKRLSSDWRVYTGFERSNDEIELITEMQWQAAPGLTFKVNNSFGVTSKATDWAPEIGMMFSVPVR